MFVVTGRLELYGNPPATTWTRLTTFADKGATSINVNSTTGWAVGDQIGIAPSFSNPLEFEKVTITNLSGNLVSFTPALNYSHFGNSSTTISKPYGTLDMRAGVAHLTRNIKFTSGPDDGFGFSLIQFGYLKKLDNGTSVVQTGKLKLTGV